MSFFKTVCIMLLLSVNTIVKAQQKTVGINLTGYERFWEEETLNHKAIIKDIDALYDKGIKDIRMPIAFEYQFKKKSKGRFLRDLIKIVKYIKSKNMTLIICYFDHTLEKETEFTNVETIKKNWVYISRKLRKYSDFIFYEILNEPNLYPDKWDEMVREIVPEIRKKDKETKILIGATNYNSIYELSRKTPFPYKNIIYTFHFYEPFIFTHQGADWVGNQTKTEKIPYPYDTLKMPKIDLKTIGTEGEVNYKDYKDMANKTSLSHKIAIISNWAKAHNVTLWCTEFGAINTIDANYRCKYFKDLIEVFKEYNIKSYLWEYKGNFGISNSDKMIINCL